MRNALESSLCIVSSVLMPAIKHGGHHKDYDFLWKFLAYEGGWNIVEQTWKLGAMPTTTEQFFVERSPLGAELVSAKSRPHPN